VHPKPHVVHARVEHKTRKGESFHRSSGNHDHGALDARTWLPNVFRSANSIMTTKRRKYVDPKGWQISALKYGEVKTPIQKGGNLHLLTKIWDYYRKRVLVYRGSGETRGFGRLGACRESSRSFSKRTTRPTETFFRSGRFPLSSCPMGCGQKCARTHMIHPASRSSQRRTMRPRLPAGSTLQERRQPMRYRGPSARGPERLLHACGETHAGRANRQDARSTPRERHIG